VRRHAKASSTESILRSSRVTLLLATVLFASLVLGVTLAFATAPSATIENATSVLYVNAHVSGHADPADHETSYHFEYVTQAQFEASEWAEASQEGFGSLPAGAGSTAVEANLSALSPSTTYHLRLFAENVEAESAEAVAATFETKAVAKPLVTTDDASAVEFTTANASGTVEATGPDPAFDASCRFEYVTQQQFEAEEFAGASQTSCVPENIPATEPSTPTPVTANLTGLIPGTTYHLRLAAQNAGGITAVPAASTFDTLASKPVIGIPAGAGRTKTTAYLHAFVNPKGAALTDCHFAYGPAPGDYSLGAAPCAPNPGTAEKATPTGADISGLAPNTTYHFQVAATNATGVSTSEDAVFSTEGASAANGPCPNSVFRTGASAGLPDCRAYEQVSPPQKNGADVIVNETRIHASRDGNRVAFSSLTGFGDAHGIGVTTEYLSSRGTGEAPSWATQAIGPPQDATGYFGTVGGLEAFYLAFSPDLSQGVLSSRTPQTEAPNVASAINLYSRDDLLTPGLGSYGLLTDSVTPQPPSLYPNLGPEFGFWKPAIADASADFSHLLVESRRNLTPDASACIEPDPDNNCPPLLYESEGGTAHLAGYVPAAPGATECTGEAPECVAPAVGSQAGRGALEPSRNSTAGTLSEDGSRAIFTVPTTPTAPDGALYLRDDHGTSGTSDDTTVRVNASERSTPDPGGERPAEYWAASADASLVFFTTQEQLTDDDDNVTSDVYRFDLNAPVGSRLERLSVDDEPADGVEPGVDGVIGASRDGSYVYFTTDNDQIIAGGPVGATGGPFGGHRIFVWHTGTIREVAGVNAFEEVDRLLGVGNPRATTSRVTPDGTYLLFTSEGTDEQLTLYGHPAYDHGATCPSATALECAEVFVYDATANGGAGDLRCASCNPTGAAATKDAFLTGVSGLGGLSSDTSYQNHPLSDDGRLVFFNTAERLSPADRNQAVDAYSYDTTTHQVSLLSGGQTDDISTFLDASSDGHDVFITTRDRLRAADTDQSRDLYDARIDGGSADPPVAVDCDPLGGSCQSAPPAPPAGGAPPQSNRVAGAGNSTRKRKHHQHRRKHHKNKHKRANSNRRAGR
jgi:WD40-like Beta Propeller Repeat